MDEQGKLMWWTGIPVFKQKLAKAEQLVSAPFQNWRQFLSYDHNEIIFYGEDDAGSGLIATKARITTLDGLLYVIFDNRFYRLYPSKMVPMHKLKKTDTIPDSVLYAITLKGVNESEDNLLIVTEKSCDSDNESSSDDIPGRDFYWLTRELVD